MTSPDHKLERSVCVAASVKSKEIGNVILHSSSDHDSLAKYRLEKAVTFPQLTKLKLLFIPAPLSESWMLVYIVLHVSDTKEIACERYHVFA